MSRIPLSSFFSSIFNPIYLTQKPDEIHREMMRTEGLQEDDIQKLHTTVPDQLTDQELLLSTISVADLVRKHSGGWGKEFPKCTFFSKD